MTLFDSVGFNNIGRMQGVQPKCNNGQNDLNPTKLIFSKSETNSPDGKQILLEENLKNYISENFGDAGETLIKAINEYNSSESAQIKEGDFNPAKAKLKNLALATLVCGAYNDTISTILSKLDIDEGTYFDILNGETFEPKKTLDANNDVKFTQGAFEFLPDSAMDAQTNLGPVWELGSKYYLDCEARGESVHREFTREAVQTPDGKIEMVLKADDGLLYALDEYGQIINTLGESAEGLFGDGAKELVGYQSRESTSKLYDGATVLFNGEVFEGGIIVEHDGTVIPTFINSEGKEMYISEYGDKVMLEDYELSHTGSIGNLSPRWEVGNTVEGGFTTALTKDYTPVYVKDDVHYLVNPENGELARDSITSEPIPVE